MRKEPVITITARLPESVHAWLTAQAERNSTSINGELIRVVRDAMDQDAR